jgi:hypothetical protein
MTKFCLTIFFALLVAFTSVNIVLCQTTNKTILNPPEWVFGSWNNLAESNTQKFEAFIFSANKIQFLSGFGEKSKTVNFTEKFKDYEVTETVEPKLYRLVFTRETSEYIYEFKICSDCLVPTDQKALTYSVTENKKVMREHSKSANLLLIRYEDCG